jgi:hypothetical protein
MGHPSQDGGHTQAASAAQHPEKSFPAGTDPAGIAQVSGLPAAHPTAVGSPVQPEIRQDTPVADMGEGYREADPETDPW